MSVMQTFNPSWGYGQSLTPSAASASVSFGGGRKSFVVTNTGSVTCYIRTGNSGVTASAADYPVLAGSQVSLTKDQDHTHLAHIAASGTGALHIIPGEGF